MALYLSHTQCEDWNTVWCAKARSAKHALYTTLYMTYSSSLLYGMSPYFGLHSNVQKWSALAQQLDWCITAEIILLTRSRNAF